MIALKIWQFFFQKFGDAFLHDSHSVWVYLKCPSNEQFQSISKKGLVWINGYQVCHKYHCNFPGCRYFDLYLPHPSVPFNWKTVRNWRSVIRYRIMSILVGSKNFHRNFPSKNSSLLDFSKLVLLNKYRRGNMFKVDFHFEFKDLYTQFIKNHKVQTDFHF